MKIVATGCRGFPGVQGGVEKHCEKLYTHLAQFGCEIIVFTRKPYVDAGVHTYKSVTLVPVSCPRNKYFEATIHTFVSILKAKRLKPDILHIHAIGPSMFAFLARAMGMKVLVTNHGADYKRKKWPLPAKMFLQFCEMIGVKFAHGVIAISDNIADDLRQKYHINAAVIPNGVEIPEPVETDEILEKYGLIKKRYILSVGRLVPEKGFDYLIGAFNALKDTSHKLRGENWKLAIVGSSDHEDRYSLSLKEEAEKSSNVIFTGFLTGQSLSEIYSHAGLFVLPSYHEGLPISLLEAMSYGISCIASDIPANQSIELSKGRFFKAGDTGSLVEKISEILNMDWTDEDRKKQIKFISEKYNWDKIAKETLTYCKKVVAGV
ncbi:MAG: glycosyltransferase family 4 protein [Nitrospirae bacterium]|nr:glycosyltransferase family 4 protein [Nitrospirota bacterium]